MTLTAQRASQRSAAVTIAPATESTVNHARKHQSRAPAYTEGSSCWQDTAPVIARRWRVWTAQERADELEPYLRRTGVGEALRTPGNQGALLLRADGCDGHVEFTLLTFWASWDAISAFAGDDVSKAVLYPEDHAYFTRWDEQVRHLAVASWDAAQAPS